MRPSGAGGVLVGQEHQHLVGLDGAARHLDPLDADGVAAGRQARIVGEADLREDQPELGGDVVAHVEDAGVEAGRLVHHHRHQVRARTPCGSRRRRGGRRATAWPASAPPAAPRPPSASRILVCARQPGGRRRGWPRRAGTGTNGRPGMKAKSAISTATVPSAVGIAAELADQRPVGGADEAALGEQHGAGDRDDDRGDLGDEAVADGEDRVGLEGVVDRHAVHQHAHGEADDEVEERDEQAGDRRRPSRTSRRRRASRRRWSPPARSAAARAPRRGRSRPPPCRCRWRAACPACRRGRSGRRPRPCGRRPW